MARWVLVLAAAGSAVLAVGGEAAAAPGQAIVAFQKDVSETSYAFCTFQGKGGDPFAAPIPGTGLLKTVGSSTTVTAVTAADKPFLNVVVGDLLVIDSTSPGARRVVRTRTSDTEVIVDTAINLSVTNRTWSYYHPVCGADAGWVNVEASDGITFMVDVVDITGTTIDYAVQCRVGTATDAVNVTTGTINADATAAGYSLDLQHSGWAECRLGLKITNDTGTQKVDAYISRR